MIHADEADQQHVDEVYEAAQEGLFDRDRETRHMLDGVHASSPPFSGPPMNTNGTSGTPPGGAPSGGGSPGDGPGGPPRLARPSAQTMLRRLASGAETPSEGTSAEAEDVLQTAQLQDSQPLRRFVTRSSSFNKEQFEELLAHSGILNVGPSAASEARLLRSHLPPSKLESPAPRRHLHAGPRPLSCMRLPMIRPDSYRFILWSSLVLLSDLTYSAFIVPISLGMWTSFYVLNWTTVCDFLFGCIFFVDMVIGFHVGFIATYNSRKLLVMNGPIVARHYLRSFGFMVDFFASLAWLLQIALVVVYHEVPGANPNTALVIMEVIRLMRFLRVIRLLLALLSNGVFATLVVETPYLKWLRNQHLMSLLYMLYLIAVVVNFLGCLWNFTAGAQEWDNTWVNHYEPFVRQYGDETSFELTKDQAMDVSRIWMYIVGNYWALSTIATVGFGDVVPQNLVENIVVIIVEVIGVLFFGLLISSISELLQQANRNARRVHLFRSKMQSVMSWMQKQNLPRRLQRRIKTFYAEVWIRQHETKEETVLFQELPHALRNEVAWQACKAVFKKVPLLQEMDEKTLYLLASKMTPFRFTGGHDLVTEGDPADRFWILIEGEVVALYHFKEAERIEGPAVVGESVLLQEHEESLRTFPCTYRTLTSCICWMVRTRDFKPMLATRPGLASIVKARALQSLADHMQQYPSAWQHKGLKRLSGMRRLPGRPGLARMSSDPLRTHHADSFGEGSGAAAVRSRLARASSPVPVQHRKTVSWGGWENASMGSTVPPAERQGSIGSEAATQHGTPTDGLARNKWQEAAAAAVAEVSAEHETQRQQRASPPQQQQQAQRWSPPQQQQQAQHRAQQMPPGLPPLPPLPGLLPVSRGPSGASVASRSSLPPVEEHVPLRLPPGEQHSVSDESPFGSTIAAGSAGASHATTAAAAGAAAAAAVAAGAAQAASQQGAAGSAEGSEAAAPGRDSPEPLSSVLVVAEKAQQVGHSAAELAAAAAAAAMGAYSHLPTPAGRLLRALSGAHREAVAASRGDAAYEQELEELAAVLQQEEGEQLAEHGTPPLPGTTAEHGEEDEEGDGGPIERLTTQQALALLQAAQEAQEREAEEREAVAASVVASLAAAANSASVGAAQGGADGSSAAAAGVAPLSAQLLAEVLREVQELRRDVDRLRNSRQSIP
ncbi:hypothetical protein COHA_003209 [Chlorella ohadii]|uniref:Cyclic nucleotide-binding domain-containing protein n=1 Tax=Chlorella ohadii TaxID=2649997 RepID=A0AAD5H3S4_9CHLO|nr:hypothetical protein COHA_003209 [Chlorella ohadii]